MKGNEVERIRLEWIKDQKTLSLQSYKSGTYMATLFLDKRKLQTIKLTVIH